MEAVIDIGGYDESELRRSLELYFLGKGNHDAPWRSGLPAALLHDDTGFELWSNVTNGTSFYQRPAEIESLHKHGSELVKHIEAGTIIINMGNG